MAVGSEPRTDCGKGAVELARAAAGAADVADAARGSVTGGVAAVPLAVAGMAAEVVAAVTGLVVAASETALTESDSVGRLMMGGGAGNVTRLRRLLA